MPHRSVREPTSRRGSALAWQSAGGFGFTGISRKVVSERDPRLLMPPVPDRSSMSEETLTRTYAKYHPEFTQEAADAIGRRPGMVRHGA